MRKSTRMLTARPAYRSPSAPCGLWPGRNQSGSTTVERLLRTVRNRYGLGVVKDSTGAAIAETKITLENVNTGVTSVATSNEAGNFDFINVAIGAYRVKAEAPGFKTSVTENFTVTVSARQRIDLTLAVGDMTQTVSVIDAAGALETESRS